MIKPRKWQAEFLDLFLSGKNKVFSLVAAPRSGKTLAASMAYKLCTPERFDKMIVVGPTDSVRSQWADAATELMINLMPLNGDWSRVNLGFDGLSMTYHQLASNQDSIKQYLNNYRTLIVLDEPHHLADQKSWGKNAVAAFENAAKILPITGTPFRSDEYRIPFMRYENNVLAADYSYGYAQAVLDGVCRELKFDFTNGVVHWRYTREDTVTGEKETEENEAAMTDINIGDEQVNRRLKAAVDPNKGLLPHIFKKAHAKLIEVRRDHKNAAGLCVCYNIQHARRTAAMIEHAAGEKPEIVTSKDEFAKEKIEKFRRSNKKWLVSVQMVSEGVDIRRLRVLCFATNIKTSMNFRQITARVGTIDGQHTGAGYVFLPADLDLIQHAEQMKNELTHVAAEMSGGNGLPLFDDDKRERQYRYIIEALGAKIDGQVAMQALPEQTQPNVSQAKQMEKLRQDIHRLANELARLRSTEPKIVHGEWLRQGGKPTSQATIDDLLDKKHWLASKVAHASSLASYRPAEKVF